MPHDRTKYIYCSDEAFAQRLQSDGFKLVLKQQLGDELFYIFEDAGGAIEKKYSSREIVSCFVSNKLILSFE